MKSILITGGSGRVGKIIRKVAINFGSNHLLLALIAKNFYKSILFLQKRRVKLLKIIYPPDPKNRLLNLGGGGKWYYPRWENIDFYQKGVYVDYQFDLRSEKKLLFSNESVKAIFTSHVFEHLPDNSVIFLLRECHRILKPNGVLRISVPDMDKAFEAYYNKDFKFFDMGGGRIIGDTLERKLVNLFASYRKGKYRGGPIVEPDLVKHKLKKLNKHDFTEWCVSLIPKNAPYKAHINAFNFEKLSNFLRKCGFSIINKSKYRSSKINVMRNKEFDNKPVISLYIEVWK